MFTILKALLAQWVVRRLVLKGLGSLLVLLPLAAILKVIGWPLLMVLGVLALPVLLFLFVIGLPILLVLLVGGAILGIVATALSLALPLLKLALVVGLPIVLMVWLARWLFRSPPKTDPGPDVA